MTKKTFIFISIALFMSFAPSAFAQSGLKFAELAQRLDPYFDKLLIQDIPRQMPHDIDYTIWGWDVGDFSGDGYYDVAFSAKLASDRGRTLHVYLFVDIDGFLTKVGSFEYDFVEIPLEIGVVIKENTCMITQKNEQFNWTVRGFTFDNGTLLQRDEYTTERIGDITRESIRNYHNLRNSERYLQTRNGTEIFSRNYLTIPSYPRGKKIYKGYSEKAIVDYTDYVFAGALHRNSSEDLSFSISSAYDDKFLYFTVNVIDDQVVPQSCDTCIADNIDLWMDVSERSGGNDRFVTRKGTRIEFRQPVDSGIFRFTVSPGNFLDIKPTVKVSTNHEMSSSQKLEARTIRTVSNVTNEGYIVKFRIPFSLFGYFSNPIGSMDYVEFGCSVIVNDYDNEFRPEEKTEMASSVFNSKDPTTYGSLILLPNEDWYGFVNNIYRDEILENLYNYGF